MSDTEKASTDLLEGLLADLDAEGDALRSAVAGLDANGWATPTPAPPSTPPASTRSSRT